MTTVTTVVTAVATSIARSIAEAGGGGDDGNAAPVFTSVPTLNGPKTAGDLVTATPGVCTGTPTPTVARQWYLDGAPISGATSSTYQTSAGQAGGVLTIRETASNAVQSGVVANSAGLTLSAPAVAGVIQKTSQLYVSNVIGTTFPKLDAFPVTPTPGNSATLMVTVFNVDPSVTMTVNIGGTDAVLAYTFNRGNIRTSSWYVPTFGSTPNRNVVIGFSGAAVYKYMSYAALECTPLAASPVDLAQGLLWYDYMGTPAGWPLTLTAAAPTTQANELLMAMAISGSGAADCLINSPASPGFTSMFYQIDSNDFQGGEASYKVLNSIQTPAVAWSKRSGGTADHWDTILVSFKFA